MAFPSFPNPFRTEGLWLKGNLHIHTTNSDGALNPYQMAFLYRANGYNFIAITDHDKLTDVEGLAERFNDFLVLPGEEIGTGRSEVGTKYHLVAINLREEIGPEGGPQGVIEEVLKQGGEVIVAHPYWSSLTVNDLLGLDGYLGLEIFNSTCLLSIGKGYSTVHWDDLMVRGRFTFGFAVDDAHWHFNPHRPVDTCYSWIMVKASEFTVESVMDGLKRGLFYSSNGPSILDVDVSDDSVYVRSSPARAITFVANSSIGERFTASDHPITEATYRVRGKETYLRIEVEDWRGRTAWTNPIIFQRDS